jgi:hypothetical protein
MKTIFFGRADEENDMVDKVTDAQKETPNRIDHDNVDVADIMDQIKRRIAQKPPAPTDVRATEGRTGAASVAPGDRGGLATRAFRLLARPFVPFVKPFLDRFIVRVNLDVNMRIDELTGRLITTQENTKLLHTMAHNLVLELTKLKIEHEALKSKVRIMEKDFEVLGKRERVLEKKGME